MGTVKSTCWRDIIPAEQVEMQRKPGFAEMFYLLLRILSYICQKCDVYEPRGLKDFEEKLL